MAYHNQTNPALPHRDKPECKLAIFVSLDDQAWPLSPNPWDESLPDVKARLERDLHRLWSWLLSTRTRDAQGVGWAPFLRADVLECALILSNDEKLRSLNKSFLDKDKPTNVLAFPDGTQSHADDSTKITLYLGDILVAFETLSEEAARQGKDLYAHLCHLCFHGLLHLLGYDHIRAQDADIMEQVEIEGLSILGIANPYEEHKR